MPNQFTTAKDPKVQQYLEDQAMTDYDKFEIVTKIRAIVLTNLPNIQEKIMYGGIMFTLDGVNQCGVYTSQNHVSLEFSQGYLLDNKNGVLEGVGHTRRHIKVNSLEEVITKNIADLVDQLRSLK